MSAVPVSSDPLPGRPTSWLSYPLFKPTPESASTTSAPNPVKKPSRRPSPRPVSRISVWPLWESCMPCAHRHWPTLP